MIVENFLVRFFVTEWVAGPEEGKSRRWSTAGD